MGQPVVLSQGNRDVLLSCHLVLLSTISTLPCFFSPFASGGVFSIVCCAKNGSGSSARCKACAFVGVGSAQPQRGSGVCVVR